MTPAVRAWVLTSEIGVVTTGIVIARTDPQISTNHWIIFAALLATALIHGWCTAPSEERRRGQGLTASVDQSGLWHVAAAILLPLTLAGVVCLTIRVMRYRIARRPLAKFCCTSFAIGSSVLLAHCGGYGLLDQLDNPATFCAQLVTAAAGYFAGQTVIIGISRGLETRWQQRWRVFGDFAENSALLTAVCSGFVFATLLHTNASLSVLALPSLVALTHLHHRLAQTKAERDKMETDALHDPLTGLPNRRGFTTRAELALDKDRSTGVDTAVLMCDIDRFKDWNTRLGHFGADEVLKSVATTLRAHIRRTDLLCRWGGEEIALVLPSTGLEEAVRRAERIRTSIAQSAITTSLPHGGQTVVLGRGDWAPVTLSIGVATAPRDGADLATVQATADRSLQCAKDNGRNRVEPSDLVG